MRASRLRTLASQCPQGALGRLDSDPLVSQESIGVVFLETPFRIHQRNQENMDLPLISIKPKAAYQRPQNRGPNSAA